MSGSDLPAPLSAPECNLRGLSYMPLHGGQLYGSDFNAKASDAEFRAGLALYWAAWNQVPAGSLPNDDKVLCVLANLGRDLRTWLRVRAVALHGFVECTDGRLYHRFLCEQAAIAWKTRAAARDRQRASRERRSNQHDGDVTVTSREAQQLRDGYVTTEEKRRDVSDLKVRDVPSLREGNSNTPHTPRGSGTTGQSAKPPAPPSLVKPVLVAGWQATAKQPALNGKPLCRVGGYAVKPTPEQHRQLLVERRALRLAVQAALSETPGLQRALESVMTPTKLAAWMRPNPGNIGSSITLEQAAAIQRLIDWRGMPSAGGRL